MLALELDDDLEDLLSIDAARLDREIIQDLFREGDYGASLAEFIRMAWPLIEPATTLKWNWHIDMICAHLEAVARLEILRLVINIPPGCMKSTIVSIMFPIWVWILRDEEAMSDEVIAYAAREFMLASFDFGLVKRHGDKTKIIVESAWFQERWGVVAIQPESELEQYPAISKIEVDPKQTNKSQEFTTTAGGHRLAVSVRGVGTGRHVHIQIIDDPIKPTEVDGKALEACAEWYDGTMSSRAKDQATFARIIIMQRLHKKDLAGRAIDTGEYVKLILPMEFEPDNRCVTPWGADPRTEPGELLWPARFPKHRIEVMKRTELGPHKYAAQCQQRPTQKGGRIFKTVYRQHWTPAMVASRIDKMLLIQSWDFTFKDLKTSDYVAGGIWGLHGAEFFMLDGFMGRVGFSESCELIKKWRKKWPRAYSVVIEDKANGSGIVDVLGKKLSGIIAVNPQGGKDARAQACEAFWAARNVWLPPVTPETAPYMVGVDGKDGMLEQLEEFPNAGYDDMVDQATQAMLHLYGGNTSAYIDAVSKMVGL